jgi:hypothetical protein
MKPESDSFSRLHLPVSLDPVQLTHTVAHAIARHNPRFDSSHVEALAYLPLLGPAEEQEVSPRFFG